MHAPAFIGAALLATATVLGGDMTIGDMRGGALRADGLLSPAAGDGGFVPPPLFELDFAAGASKVATTQTINSIGTAALWLYDLAACDATDCDPTAGATLPITGGTAPTLDLPGPVLDARGVSFITGQAEYQAASTATGDVTTGDLLALAVFRYAGTSTTIAEKREAAGSELGYSLGVNAAGRLELIADDGAGAPSATSAVLTSGAYYCCSCYIDRDDATTDGGRCYCNNTAGPAAAATSSGSITNADALTLGADSQGGTEFDGAAALAGLWASAAWYPGGASNPTQWSAHHLDICGGYMGLEAPTAVGDASPVVLSRASTAYVAQYEAANTRTRLALVANDWIRTSCRDEGFNSLGATECGLMREDSETNNIARSEEFDNAFWTKNDLTITADATVAPNGETTADDLICSTVASEDHFVLQTGGALASRIASVFAKAGAVDHIIIRTGSGNGDSQFFNVNACTVGSNDNNGIANVLAGHAEDYGDGWCRVTSVVQNPTTFYIYTAAADGSFNYACGDTVTTQVSLWGVMSEDRTDRQPSSSYVATGATSITRAADDVRWAGAGNVADTTGAAYISFLPQSWTITLGDRHLATISKGATPLADSVRLLLDVSVTPDAFQTVGSTASGTEWDITGTTDLTDGAAHTAAVTWQTDEAIAFVDGLQEGATDTSVITMTGADRIEVGAREDGASRFGELVTNVRVYGAAVKP